MLSSSAGQLTIIACLLLLQQRCSAASVATAYCSTLNTGADNTPSQSIYQSQGLCSTYCESDFAYGILLGKECWCSNYAPDTHTSSSDCSDSCPGYPSDTCGNASDQLYEYIALKLVPSGTEGASSSTAAASSNVQTTETAASTTIPPSTTPDAVSITSSATTLITTSSSSSSSWSATPITSIETITNGGGIKTVTITPTAPPAASETLTSNQKSGSGSSLSGGQAAGLTIGLIAFLAIIGGIGYFCWRKRKASRAQSEYGGISRQGSTLVSGGAAHPPSRTMSENSRYVLTTDGRAVYPSWEDDNPGSRSSRFVPIDPRLDPNTGIYQNPAARRSHDSINTINDARDYSRKVAKPVLRAMNPDPDTKD